MDVVELAPDVVPHGFDEFVERHADGTFFHGSVWRDLVRRHFPAHRPRYFEVQSEGRRVGVLPAFQVRSLLAGRAIVSVPYGVYGGPLCLDARAEHVLLERLREIVAAESLRFAELRCRTLPAAASEPSRDGVAALAANDLYATFVRALPRDPEECLAMIPRKSRASTRQARDRHGLRCVEAPERLDDFHRLFVLNKQRLGSPAFSRAWFADLLKLGRRRVRLHAVIAKDDRVVVAVLSFLHRDEWNPYYSGSTPDADRLAASNFAYWQLMRTASEEGFARFDFGRSRVGTGPYDFKRNMGFEPSSLPYRYVLGEGARVPDVNPGNEKFSLPQRVIRSLPYPIARAVGPTLLSQVP